MPCKLNNHSQTILSWCVSLGFVSVILHLKGDLKASASFFSLGWSRSCFDGPTSVGIDTEIGFGLRTFFFANLITTFWWSSLICFFVSAFFGEDSLDFLLEVWSESWLRPRLKLGWVSACQEIYHINSCKLIIIFEFIFWNVYPNCYLLYFLLSCQLFLLSCFHFFDFFFPER